MSGQEIADKELIARYLAGDHHGFELLYERYRRPLYGYLNRMLPGQTATVDDLFQKTWLKVLRRLEGYVEQGTFFAWLLRIAHNTAMDHFRHEGNQPTVELDEVQVAEERDLPWQSLSRAELLRAIEAAVAQLPPEQREVFLLRRRNVSFKDIAAIQECSLNTALGRMHYATKRLRQVLQELS